MAVAVQLSRSGLCSLRVGLRCMVGEVAGEALGEWLLPDRKLTAPDDSALEVD